MGPGSLRIAGIDLGLTDGEFRITHRSDWFDVLVDQSVGVQRKHLLSRRVFCRTNVAEASLTNFYLAWGQPPSGLSGQTLSFTGGTLGVVTAVFVAANPSGFDRNYNFQRVVSIGETASEYRKDAITLVPIKFEVLPSEDGGDDFYTIFDATI